MTTVRVCFIFSRGLKQMEGYEQNEHELRVSFWGTPSWLLLTVPQRKTAYPGPVRVPSTF